MRALKMLWTLPNTLIGLVLGFLSFAWPRWNARGALIFESGRGSCKLLAKQGYTAITFGHVIIITRPGPIERIVRHEFVHVQQYENWGPFFLLAYAFHWARLELQRKNGYINNPFEVEAREAERGSCSIV